MSTPKPTLGERAPNCPYCGKATQLKNGDFVYPHRRDLSHRLFYVCTPCDARVGCHPGTQTPLGEPTNSATRRARVRAHSAFDQIWREGSMSRQAAYAWLAEKLGIEGKKTHIGSFDIAMCERVVQACAARRSAR